MHMVYLVHSNMDLEIVTLVKANLLHGCTTIKDFVVHVDSGAPSNNKYWQYTFSPVFSH